MRLVLLGKPLSGKGTQARFLSQKIKIPTFSLGDILRKECKNKTVLWKKIEPNITKGKLVSDMIILPLLQEYLPKKNFILDGYPRNTAQAKKLDRFCSLDLVIDIHCSNGIILRRIRARETCLHCGRIYGLDIPPKKKGICDFCKKKLVHRTDDTLKTVKKRLQVYTKETKPLIQFYQKKDIYFKVNGGWNIALIQKRILRKIESIK